MMFPRISSAPWTIGFAAIAALSVPTLASAALMTPTQSVVFEFSLPGTFSFERVIINFVPGPTEDRFDFGESIQYEVGTSPFLGNVGVGYHHQGFSYGSDGYSGSIRNASNSARVEFPAPAGPLFVTANYVNGNVDIRSMSINDNAGTNYDGTLVTEPAVLGDANNDGVVSADDFAAVQANFGQTGATDGLLLGDANDDGVVSADDFASIQTNFGNVLPASTTNTPIPEPATIAVLALAAVAMTRRRP